ncbi:type II toxin-antitoxin system VapC family toxin [Herbaspirillum seropedicae]|uniref:type II toxin-antitoxin system VapC family toxin n=1 Tax=Herbaspirillum seropedicae TaxID=964 RepID=UPI00111FEB55|nr:type II toxin-antitoxin system VapC family toxin [Herbaspirillum seropedicae]QDD63060.1 type II toxin-antitoxin system VapC family toxin [Herbaspirillum seropedicae]
MSYLIDTNVLSELRRRAPDPGVLHWFSQRPAGTLYLSVLTLGELRKGIDALSDEGRKLHLLDWLETELPAFFAGRILPVDATVADRWGRLQAQARRPLPAIDSLLAATALTHGLSLITRNLKDFQYADLQVISPWSR